MIQVNFEHRLFIVKNKSMPFEQMQAWSDALLGKPSGVIFHKLDFNLSRHARFKSLQKLRLCTAKVWPGFRESFYIGKITQKE